MMNTKPKDLLKILQADGWQIARINSSHQQLASHPETPDKSRNAHHPHAQQRFAHRNIQNHPETGRA
jgi:hypothetical protein